MFLFLASFLVGCQFAQSPKASLSPTATSQTFSATEVGRWQPGQLEIILLDVRHGDAQLIIAPNGSTLLIDAGEEEYAPTVAAKLQQILGKTQVDYFLASHYHVDHIGAVVPLFRDLGWSVRNAVLDRGGGRDAYNSPTYQAYFDYVTDTRRSFKHIRLNSGDSINLDPSIKLDVLSVGDSDARANCGIPVLGLNDNDYSVVLWLAFGAFDYWTAGDLSGLDGLETTDVESACARRIPRRADLMKADHHGISVNNNSQLLDALRPQVVLISLDVMGNTGALLRLNQYGKLFATNRIIALGQDRITPIVVEDNDDIIVTSRDGKNFIVEGTSFVSY